MCQVEPTKILSCVSIPSTYTGNVNGFLQESLQLTTTEILINTHWALFILSLIRAGLSAASTLCDHDCDLHPYFPNNWNESSRYISQSYPAIMSNIQMTLCNAWGNAECHRTPLAIFSAP